MIASPGRQFQPMSSHASSAHIPIRWLALVRWAWIVCALLLLVTFLVNIPAYYQSSRTGCTLSNPGNCPTGLLTPGNFQALAHLHLSGIVVATILATLTLAVSALYWMVGFLIFWRKNHEWVGLFSSLACILLGAIAIFGFSTSLQTPQLIQLLTGIIYFIVNFVGPIFLFIFPNGRFTPRWVWAAFALFLLSELPFMPVIVSSLGFFLPVGVQIYRYLRIYDAVQRQQTKWFVFGVGVGFFFLIIYYALGAVVHGLSAPDSWYQLLNVLPWLLIWVLLLLSVSVAILRHRLWDIDIIINRTLVYGSLTILLVALYAGLILALQALVRAATGSISQSPLAIVGSTLVIATLVRPLQRRIQSIIDRRFYRRKYDAQKTLAAFSATLRDEVDLQQLGENLLAVVEETMQPAHVSLWIRPAGHEREKGEAAGG